MKWIRTILLLIVFAGAAVFVVFPGKKSISTAGEMPADTLLLDSTLLELSTIASDLEVPWDIAWGPDSTLWFTEQNGKVSRLFPGTGKKELLIRFPDIYRKRLGLLSMVIHPDIKRIPFVFFNYLFLKDTVVFAKIVRYRYGDGAISSPVIIREWRAHAGHNGSRMAIGNDGKLMVAVGDVTVDSFAQNEQNPYGKILRINIDGTVPADNPFPGSPVWSLGFRVPQGLVYSTSGNLYSAEHGDATDDELNLIVRGSNYGWPNVTGFCDKAAEQVFCKQPRMKQPLKAWTPTIAPAGISYYGDGGIAEWQNAILLTTLKTQTLRILSLDPSGSSVVKETVLLKKKYGRLRDVCVSPAGDVYLSTSNRDWNPPENFPVASDDRIIRIREIGMRAKSKNIPDAAITARDVTNGKSLYADYCASCHKPDGEGIGETFPPLRENSFVSGNKKPLITALLQGLNGPRQVKGITYEQAMPGFAFLSDGDLAMILTYIRTQFNKANSVSSHEVKTVRDSIP